MKEGKKAECPEKPLTASIRKCHILKPENSSRNRDSNPLSSNGDRLGKLYVLFVCCLTSQQRASVSQGRICTDYFTCCHTEIEVTDKTFHLTQSQCTDTGPTSPSTDPITQAPGWVATGVPMFKSLV